MGWSTRAVNESTLSSKTCFHCHQEKAISQFRLDKRYTFPRFRALCRQCEYLANESSKKRLVLLRNVGCEHCGTPLNNPWRNSPKSCNSCWRKMKYAADPTAHPRWSGGPIECECALCKSIVIAKQYKARRGRVFCSYTCNSIFQLINRKRRQTDIERRLESDLIRLNLPYKSEVRIANITIADFVLEDYRLVLYADGDYWHRRPGRLEADAMQTKKLIEAGYFVKRFWGKEINAGVHTAWLQQLALSTDRIGYLYGEFCER